MTPSSLRKSLRRHAKRLQGVSLLDLFAREGDRLGRLSLDCGDLHFDFSKTHVDAEALEALLGWIEAAEIGEFRDRMMRGDVVNPSENSGAWHTLMRADDAPPAIAEFRRESERALEFAEGVREGAIKAADGAAYRHIIHLGVGGSGLGPQLMHEAFADAPATHAVDAHFVSNLDAQALGAATRVCDPERTLIIAASKSFATAETLANLRDAVEWMRGRVEAPMRHVAGAAADIDAALAEGLDASRVFRIPPALGGRFSIWSAINLLSMIRLGRDAFGDFINGAAQMDRHFQQQPAAANAPMLAAALDVWYRDYLGAPTRAVFPYEHRLRSLPAYLQQLEMESNGKDCRGDGEALDGGGAAIVWGGVGTDMQHSVFQLMHQGRHLIPAEFVCALQAAPGDARRHRRLLCNCLAQAAALMRGNLDEETDATRRLPGNRPSSVIALKQFTPRALGALLAFYEHRAAVCGALWGLNSFDQMGVELGKKLALQFAEAAADQKTPPGADASTKALLKLIADAPP